MSLNLHKDNLLLYGALVTYQGLLLLQAPLVHPVQAADDISIIDGLYVLQDVQVIQIASDYIMTISG